MDHLLTQAAHAYCELQQYQYHILLGHRGKTTSLTIEFPSSAFHHLAGLHKAGYERVKNKKNALEYILDEGVPDNLQLGKMIEDRLLGILQLKQMIEANSLIFRYRGHEFPGSLIDADYLVCDNCYLFFINENYPESIFTPTSNQTEAAKRCMRFTTLKIERERISDGQMEMIYVSPSYKPELEEG